MPIVKYKPSDEITSVLLTPCVSKEHFNKWLIHFLGVTLANHKVSRFATSCPLDFAWSVYSYAIEPAEKHPEPLKIMAIAARGSQKTLLLASCAVAILLHDRRSVLHYAASRSQAQTGFNYIKRFLTNKFINQFICERPAKDHIALNIPHYKDLNDVKFLTAESYQISTYSVESKHSSYLSCDEIGSLTNDKLSAFKYMSGIPTNSDTGKSPIILQISSRKNMGSVIEDQISTAAETSLAVVRWTAFEMTKQCPEERYKSEPMTYYGSPFVKKVITEEEYNSLIERDKGKFYKADGYKNCFECPIAHSCLSEAAKQTCNYGVLNSVQKTIFDFKQTKDLWTAQRMSLEPTKEGNIFSNFSIERHCKTEKEISEMLNSKDANLANHIKMGGYFVAAGIDHSGGSAEGTIMVGIVDPKGRVFIVDEYGEPGLQTDKMITKLKTFDELYRFTMLFPDVAAVDKNRILERAGFTVSSDLRRQVMAGIDLVREKLLNADGVPNLYFNVEKCPQSIKSMQKYRFKSTLDGIYSDSPAEENSHFCDALRYLIQNIVEKQYCGVNMENSVSDSKEIKSLNDVRRAMDSSLRAHLSKLGVETTDEVVEGGGTIKWII